jgi:hypothetical protein
VSKVFKDYFVWKALGFGVLANLFISCLPVAPLLTLIGGFLGAFILQKSLAPQDAHPRIEDKQTYYIFGSVCNGLLIAYIYTLLFFATLGKPIQDDWFKFGAYENITRSSEGFKWLFYAASVFISAISFSLGAYISFKLKVGSPKPNDEKLLSNLPLDKLDEYLDN